MSPFTGNPQKLPDDFVVTLPNLHEWIAQFPYPDEYPISIEVNEKQFNDFFECLTGMAQELYEERGFYLYNPDGKHLRHAGFDTSDFDPEIFHKAMSYRGIPLWQK